MIPPFDVFANPEKLNLSEAEMTVWLPQLLSFLESNPTRVGRILRGERSERLGKKGCVPWRKKDVILLEKLLLTKVESQKAIATYLSILHRAAYVWSAAAEVKVKLPRFLSPPLKGDNPFSFDYATAVEQYTKWKEQIAAWVATLSSTDGDIHDRELLLSTFLVSAVVHGGALGIPVLAALIRALADRKRCTFSIGGRIHVELSLTLKGIADAEMRLWLPDALTATLWNRLSEEDAEDMLARVVEKNISRQPYDLEIFRRLGRLVRAKLAPDRKLQLNGIEALRRCTRAVAISNMQPVLVAYGNSQNSSSSLPRVDIRRLFPDEALIEYDGVRETQERSTFEPEAADRYDANEADPQWLASLTDAAQSSSVDESLAKLAKDTSSCSSLRLLSAFGKSLLSSTSYTGKFRKPAKVSRILKLVARALGTTLDAQDLSALAPEKRREIYLDAINQQPIHKRRGLMLALLDFDTYLVTRNSTALPVPRKDFPWLPKIAGVDANLLTHDEYSWLLRVIETEWPAQSGPMRKKLALLIVILAFRCGLRISEIKRLRISDLLIRGSQTLLGRSLAELQIRWRKREPLKSRNAIRSLSIGVLLSDDEFSELRSWYQMRIGQGALLKDRLFALPHEKLKQIPERFFDKVNAFLRRTTKYANDGRGIHLHNLRHSFGGWLFTSLLLSDVVHPPTLFPGLDETNTWLAQGKSIRQALYRHREPSRKDPFVVARACGHSSLDVSAGSYIHLFPWLLAAFLDRSEMMRPDIGLVKIASGLAKKDTTLRRWLREGGPHTVPVQLLKRSGAIVRHPTPGNAVPISRTPSSSDPEHLEDWLSPAWDTLIRCARNELAADANPGIAKMVARANLLARSSTKDGRHRHQMETWVPDKQQPDESRRLACPLKPRNNAHVVPTGLVRSISRMHADPQLLNDALALYREHREKGEYVRFDSIEDLANVNRYIEFLRQLGLGKREIEVVSGDTEPGSISRKEWRDGLDEPNTLVNPGGKSRNFGAKSALSVRPRPGANGIVPAGFRYVMAMAFIVFGEDSYKLSTTESA